MPDIHEILSELVQKIREREHDSLAGDTRESLNLEAIKVAEKQIAQQEPTSGCPCLYTTPCRDSCTCANPVMSGGCSRCASYGSDEQRLKAAKLIADLIDNGWQERERVEKLRELLKGTLPEDPFSNSSNLCNYCGGEQQWAEGKQHYLDCDWAAALKELEAEE